MLFREEYEDVYDPNTTASFRAWKCDLTKIRSLKRETPFTKPASEKPYKHSYRGAPMPRVRYIRSEQNLQELHSVFENSLCGAWIEFSIRASCKVCEGIDVIQQIKVSTQSCAKSMKVAVGAAESFHSAGSSGVLATVTVRVRWYSDGKTPQLMWYRKCLDVVEECTDCKVDTERCCRLQASTGI
jgi:hypothetical protein